MANELNQIPKQLDSVKKLVKNLERPLTALNRVMSNLKLDEKVIKELFGGSSSNFEKLKSQFQSLEKIVKELR